MLPFPAPHRDLVQLSAFQSCRDYTTATLGHNFWETHAVLTPPVDLGTALLLFLVLGRQWLLLPGLVLEAIPGVGVLPFWLLVVGAIAVLGTPRPNFERH